MHQVIFTTSDATCTNGYVHCPQRPIQEGQKIPYSA